MENVGGSLLSSLGTLIGWCRTRLVPSIFFYGTLKGWGGRCEKVLFDPRGKKAWAFSWNLGVNNENNAETYALWMGLKI